MYRILSFSRNVKSPYPYPCYIHTRIRTMHLRFVAFRLLLGLKVLRTLECVYLITASKGIYLHLMCLSELELFLDF